MTRIIKPLRRVVFQALPMLLAIAVLNFMLLKLAPGDAADVMAAEAGGATAETMENLRRQFGLDRSIPEQLLSYLLNLAHGNLGYSPRYQMPVSDLIMQRLPGTLALMGISLGLAILLGLVIGTIMAISVGRWQDRVMSVLATLFYSVPTFWIGLMMTILFSIKLGWLPSGGSETIASGLTGFAAVWDKVRHMVLPATSLALFYIAIYARLTRAAVLEVQSQDFVRTAMAKGLTVLGVIRRHILPNALIPITTIAGMHVGSMLGGAVVVETIFAWPGLGRLAFESVMSRDFSVLLGVLLISSVLVLAVNALVDLLQSWLDPRIES